MSTPTGDGGVPEEEFKPFVLGRYNILAPLGVKLASDSAFARTSLSVLRFASAPDLERASLSARARASDSAFARASLSALAAASDAAFARASLSALALAAAARRSSARTHSGL